MTGSRIKMSIIALAAAAIFLLAGGGFAAAADGNGQTRALQTRTLARNLTVPWAMDFLPNGNIIFTERSGNIKVKRIGISKIRLLKKIDPVVQTGESGLLGLALHPNYAKNHFVYVYYTYQKNGQLFNKVVRYTRSGSILGNATTIIKRIPGSGGHDGGRIKFGPDGLLYITTGDSLQPDLAQDVTSLAGKILRLRGNGRIPAGNPFGDSPVYSLGHRNPQGLAWDSGGRLWATEHGPSGNDEINLILPGRNYGWPTIQDGETQSGLKSPLVYAIGTTWAPSGAAFLGGSLYFAGLRGQSLFRIRRRSPGQPTAYFSGEFGRLRDVVVGPDGFLYIATNNRDGRGNPVPADDRIIKVDPSQL